MTKSKTRDKILDTSEKLFSEYGFDGVSVRDITRTADVRLASINYHFGSKEELFEEVLARRAHVLTSAREEALREIDFEALSSEEAIEAVIRSFVGPMLEFRIKGGVGWKNYCRLIAQQAVLRNNQKTTSKFFDGFALEFISALERVVPGLDERLAHYAFQFLIGSALYVFAENSRLDILSVKRLKSSDLEDICAVLVPFLAAGVTALGEAG